jgi:alpha-D-ribose 1-methylphosphonate 5-triphosphate synthase subunit PhnH
VQVADFSGKSFGLAGPGIKGSRKIAVSGLPDDFTTRLTENRELFPRGVDLVLVAAERIMALPRSIRISEIG